MKDRIYQFLSPVYHSNLLCIGINVANNLGSTSQIDAMKFCPTPYYDNIGYADLSYYFYKESDFKELVNQANKIA